MRKHPMSVAPSFGYAAMGSFGPSRRDNQPGICASVQLSQQTATIDVCITFKTGSAGAAKFLTIRSKIFSNTRS
jgi:hypothetical protein